MNILIVEDEAVLRKSLADGLGLSIGGATIHSSASVEEAQEWMNPPPDLIVSDVRLPGRSGIDFLLETRKQSPSTRFILMTAFGETISEEQAMAQGAIKFLNKPFAIKELINYVNDLKSAEPTSAQLQGISLVDLMQVLVMGKRTIQIDVATRKGTGQIYLVKGEVIHAQVGGIQGEQAFFALSTQASGNFSTRLEFQVPQQTIDTPFQFLVMEAMRLLDEGHLVEIVEATAPKTTAQGSQPDASKSAASEIDLAALEDIDGFVSACVVDASNGNCICRSGECGPGLPERVHDEVRALQKMSASLKLANPIEDVMFTLSSQYHLIRPVGSDSAYLHVVLKRTKSNLGVARHLARAINKKPHS